MERRDYSTSRQGKLRVVAGQAKITSEITWASDQITFGVLHLADHSVIGGVRQFQGDDAYRVLDQELEKALSSGDLAELVRLVEKNFGTGLTLCDISSATSNERYSASFWKKPRMKRAPCIAISTTSMRTLSAS